MNRFLGVDEEIDLVSLIDNPDIALISDEIETRSELNKAFIKYIKLPGRDKRFSDYYSCVLFGCNVPCMFYSMKNSLKDEDQSKVESKDTLFVTEPDLYYNKKAFDNGDINLCFVIGYSGSGKSVLTREYKGDNIERVELDDIVCIKDHLSLEDIRAKSDLMYSFFAGEGAKYYISRQERNDFKERDKVFVDFINFACEYAGDHKDRKFIIEGIWTYLFFGDPGRFDDYAVFIKGTSLIKSKLRRLKRESGEVNEDAVNKLLEFGYYIKDTMVNDKNVDVWRHHFEGDPRTDFVKEDSKLSVIHANIMRRMNMINECFVHRDEEGIRNIMEESDGESIVVEECKRAIADLG